MDFNSICSLPMYFAEPFVNTIFETHDTFFEKGNRRGCFYGFNGKEKIDEQYGIEGTAYDFGARLYDSRLGRWMAVDPKFRKYSEFSPYVFALLSPIRFKDFEGEDIVIKGKNKTTGEVVTYATIKSDFWNINITIPAIEEPVTHGTSIMMRNVELTLPLPDPTADTLSFNVSLSAGAGSFIGSYSLVYIPSGDHPGVFIYKGINDYGLNTDLFSVSFSM